MKIFFENFFQIDNCFFRVRSADFEAFDALLMDSESQKNDSDSEYGQVEPRMMNIQEAMRPRNQPPSLPNHLLHKEPFHI